MPYWDSSIRDLPYAVLNPQFIRIYHWVSSNSTYSSLDIFEISQETSRQLITAIVPDNLQPFGLDGPHPFNTVCKGVKYMTDNGFSGTLWLDVGGEWTKNETYRNYLQDLVKNKGWEVGIHYSRRLNDLPFEEAIALMKAEYDYVVKNFGCVPTSWCSLQNADNVALAAWAFDNLNMIWRNGSSGVHNLPNISVYLLFEEWGYRLLIFSLTGYTALHYQILRAGSGLFPHGLCVYPAFRKRGWV